VLVVAATCLLVSPITWAHHMVWVVPALLWLALAPDRPRGGPILAAGAAVLFWCAPIWWVPYKNTSDLHLGAWQLVAGNSFVLATVVFLVGVSGLLLRSRRRAGRRRPSIEPA
jgi:alpha-1,2-mannosyltransferase